MNLSALLSRWLNPARPDPDALAALERAIHYLGPQLKSVGNLERKLRRPLRIALDHCEHLVASLPPEVELDRSAVASNPVVHALFPSADALAEAVGSSRHVRSFLTAGSGCGADHVHALLAARRAEKSVLGVALEGDTLRRDVPQTLIYFSGHVISEPAPAADEARARLLDAAVDSLLMSFATHVQAIRDELASIETARGIERTQLAVMRQSHREARLAEHTRKIYELNERLRHDIEALQPDRVASALAEHLEQPERCLRLESVTLRALRNGVLLGEGTPQTEDELVLDLCELVSRDRRKHVVLPVRIPMAFARDAVARANELSERYMLV